MRSDATSELNGTGRLPTADTTVTFPAGAVRGTGTVLAALSRPAGGVFLVVDETPFHPLDHRWPDQPADRGEIAVSGQRLAVADCLTGAAPMDAEVAAGGLLVGDRIPVARGAAGWRWYVLHAVDPAPGTAADLVGQRAELVVDERRRAALSTGHTGCHLAALALNQVLAGRWRKPARLDGLGHPDFDSLAITSSRVLPAGSTDAYRLGRSLRKTGFDTADLAAALPGLRAQIGAVLAGWIAADGAVRIDVPGPGLCARRTWSCDLPEGTPSIPCGGTHLRRLGELGSLAVDLTLDDEASVLTMHTRSAPADRSR